MTARTLQTRVKVPPFSRQHVIQAAERLSKQYAHTVDPNLALFGISFDAVYDQIIYPEYGISIVEDRDLGFDESGSKVLGEYDPMSNVAYIDASLHPSMKDPRRTFTCWHEVGGHGVLQGAWLREELRRLHCESRIVTTVESLDRTTIYAIERQANLFAAHAGAPTWLLRHVIRETFNLTYPIRYIGPMRYQLDVRNRCIESFVKNFNHLCRDIASHIQFRFGWMSIEALSYRIEQLSDMVVDTTIQKFTLRRTAPPTFVASPAACASALPVSCE